MMKEFFKIIERRGASIGDDIAHELTKLKVASWSMAIGGAITLIGAVLIPFVLADLLIYFSDGQLPTWAAYSLVSLLLICVGLAAIVYSRTKFSEIDMSKPQQGISSGADELQNQAIDTAEELKGITQDKIDEVKQFFSLRHHVNERPWAAFSAAVVGGFLMRDVLIDRKGTVGIKKAVQDVYQKFEGEVDNVKRVAVAAGLKSLLAFAKGATSTSSSSGYQVPGTTSTNSQDYSGDLMH